MDLGFDQELESYNERHPGALAVAHRRESGDIVLALGGELDMKASSEASPLLESALRECPSHGKLLLDMTRVGYVSSTGVGLLATTMVEANKLSIKLVLLNIPTRVWNIMNALGLLSFFAVEESCE